MLSREDTRIVSVSTSTGTERPLRTIRKTVRCGVVEIMTPLSPENGPKVIVTMLPLVTAAFRQTSVWQRVDA